MQARVLLPLLGLFSLGFAEICTRQNTSPGKEILCYTSTDNIENLKNNICKCTTLVHHGHDIKNLSITHIQKLKNYFINFNPFIQFVIGINDVDGRLKISAIKRQEAIAKISTIFNEVDGIELNMTAGSKERLVHFVKGLKDEMIRKSNEKRIFILLPSAAEQLAKQYDIKELSKYTDLFTLSTHYLMDKEDLNRTFHPSRLMGLFDMLNTDSLVDLVHGLGADKSKIIISLPAIIIDRNIFCDNMKEGEWTIERDEDLTAPYAFKNKTWIAFEDEISTGIKGKYVILRNLAGLAIRDIENDVTNNCGKTITEEVYHSFSNNKRKTRQAVLTSLHNDIYYPEENSYPNTVKSSNYRINRVVDTEGKIHAIRENTQTEFSCASQGYFVHPKSCNRFYRCVKFNQAVDEYSVFEFDCPAGLAFDERTDVCVWPGSLSEGSPCPGSPEIAPSSARRFRCPGAGYYADPENCRWFFACMDLGQDEMMSYEFRCPYGLVFDEEKLACEWPWLVPKCGGTNYEKNYGGQGVSTQGGYNGGYDGNSQGSWQGNDQSGNNGNTQNGWNTAGGSGYDGNSQSSWGGNNQDEWSAEGGGGYDGNSEGSWQGSDQSGNDGNSQNGWSATGVGGYDGNSQGTWGGNNQNGYDGNSQGTWGTKGSVHTTSHGYNTEYTSTTQIYVPNYTSPRTKVPEYTTPRTNVPKYTTPRTYVPNYTSPRTEVPEYTTPRTDVPKYTTPRTDVPEYTTTRTYEPKYTTPRTYVPNYTSPQTEVPKYTTPRTDVPKYTTPRNDVPKYTTPRTYVPNYTSPRTEVPKYTTPQNNVPEYTTPRTYVPNYTSPRTEVPEYTTPRNEVPEYTTPRNDVPEYTTPRTYEPKYTTPDDTKTPSYQTEYVNKPITVPQTYQTPVPAGDIGTIIYADKSATVPQSYQTPVPVEDIGTIIYADKAATLGYQNDNRGVTNQASTNYNRANTGSTPIYDNTNDYKTNTASQGSISTLGYTSTDEYVFTESGSTSGEFKTTNNGVTQSQTIATVNNQEENIVKRVKPPVYVQSQPGTSGSVFTNGVRTIYDSTAVPQTAIYDNPAVTSSIGYKNKISSVTPLVVVTGQTGNNYYPNNAGQTTQFSIGQTGVTQVSSVTESGNQYYTNQAGQGTYSQGTSQGQTYQPSTAIALDETTYYKNQAEGLSGGSIATNNQDRFSTPASEIISGNYVYNNQAENNALSVNNVNYSSKITSGNEYYKNQAGNTHENGTINSSNKNNGYKINEYYDNGGRGTIRYNNGLVSHKYTENDAQKNHGFSGFSKEYQGSQIQAFTPPANLENAYTKEGFTKTGPTKTGITTAQVSGSGTYVAGAFVRPTPPETNIGENAFATNNRTLLNSNNAYDGSTRTTINDKKNSGYQYENPILTIKNQYDELTSGYKYNKPSIEFNTGPILVADKNINPKLNIQVYNSPINVPVAPKTTSPAVVNTSFYNKPTVTISDNRPFSVMKNNNNKPTGIPTVQPLGYTTNELAEYQTTVYTAARVPTAVSTVRPVIDNGYKTIVSSTSIPVTIQTVSNINYDLKKGYNYEKPQGYNYEKPNESFREEVTSTHNYQTHNHESTTINEDDAEIYIDEKPDEGSYGEKEITAKPTTVTYRPYNKYETTTSNKVSTGGYNYDKPPQGYRYDKPKGPFNEGQSTNPPRQYTTTMANKVVTSGYNYEKPNKGYNYDKPAKEYFDEKKVTSKPLIIYPLNKYESTVTSQDVTEDYNYDKPNGYNYQKPQGYNYEKPKESYREEEKEFITIKPIQPTYETTTTDQDETEIYIDEKLEEGSYGEKEITVTARPTTVTYQPQYEKTTTNKVSTDGYNYDKPQGYNYDKPKKPFNEGLSTARPPPVVTYHPQKYDTTQGYTYEKPQGTFGEKIPSKSMSYENAELYEEPTVTIKPKLYKNPSITTTIPTTRVTYKAPFQIDDSNDIPTQRPVISKDESSGYNYPRPSIKFVTTPAPSIMYSTMQSSDSRVSPLNPSISRDRLVNNNNNNRGNSRFTSSQEEQQNYSKQTALNYSQLKNEQSDKIANNQRISFTTQQPAITTYSGNFQKQESKLNNIKQIDKPKSRGKVVVKYSDLHPVLLGKLGGECICKSDPFADFRSNKPLLIESSKGKIDLRNYDETDVYVDLESSEETTEKNIKPLDKIKLSNSAFNIEINRPSITSTTTSSPLRISASDIEASASSTNGQISLRTGKSLGQKMSRKTQKSSSSEDYVYSDDIGVLELTPGGRAECARPGLFRHPKFCNKFYICHWDQWKKKFTLHVFNCPIHLTFDRQAGACNWPTNGPTCQDNTLLV
ncbi:hypothetical protein HCN44_005819 [Aphidius gifuensis]|uniref:Chitin-binding type-2 domain-containing protein n=1 Tax=Aphidius gifuensis TaxID=684658 RepID=A0A834XV04_APHGI|nr:hypothetical protein HCN44_005819 [Aphidius gifuensis]